MIEFRSEVGPDVMMFDKVAKQMLDLIGKEMTVRGVITVEQLPDAIAALKTAVAADKALRQGREADDEEGEAEPHIGVAQRAPPFIELLEISLARGKPVTWGF